jgi:uncharacterized protein (DUF1499 family)
MNTGQETMKQHSAAHGSAAAYTTWAGVVIAMLAGSAAIASGLGSRVGWWHYSIGFRILEAAAITGLAAAALSLIGGIATGSGVHRREFFAAVAGLLIGLAVAGIPWSWMMTARSMPSIHDITTDMQHPPQFVVLMPLRKDAENTPEYGGPAVAAMQQTAFPDIRPLILPTDPRKAFDRALVEANKRGWQIVAADRAAGRIEAIATTFWFGFKDDIVVRVAASGEGSRVDVRSVSRVGTGDIGTNARRIRAYLTNLALLTTDSGGSIGY